MTVDVMAQLAIGQQFADLAASGPLLIGILAAGQQIAGMGNEGFSTGSHLHFELHPGGGAPVDPAPWFAEHGITFS